MSVVNDFSKKLTVKHQNIDNGMKKFMRLFICKNGQDSKRFQKFYLKLKKNTIKQYDLIFVVKDSKKI